MTNTRHIAWAILVCAAIGRPALAQDFGLPTRLPAQEAIPTETPPYDAAFPGSRAAYDAFPSFVPPAPHIASSRPAWLPPADNQPWSWQLLPDGLIYHAYLAGVKESRLSSTWVHERDRGWQWESTLGGRAGLIRFGTQNDFYPEGFQLDVEGSGQVRLDFQNARDVDSVDFRVGAPLTWRQGRWEGKFGFYHLSSHAGDEFLLKNPNFKRINFTRDVLVLAAAYRPTPALRLYTEAGWAFQSDVSEPWEFQFGIDYAPFNPTGFWGAPFAAVNGHLRQEVNFGGNVVVQAGWAWRGAGAGHLLRAGFEYFNGKSRQFEFFNQSEEQIGMGIWYDY